MTVAEHTAPTGELGRGRTRVEDRRLVTGHGRFVEDVYLPGTLQMAVVRCPHPHARIVRIDAAAARALPGVLVVLTGADVPPIANLPIVPLVPELKVPPYEPLAVSVARAAGQPVAVVVAEGRGAAAD